MYFAPEGDTTLFGSVLFAQRMKVLVCALSWVLVIIVMPGLEKQALPNFAIDEPSHKPLLEELFQVRLRPFVLEDKSSAAEVDTAQY